MGARKKKNLVGVGVGCRRFRRALAGLHLPQRHLQPVLAVAAPHERARRVQDGAVAGHGPLLKARYEQLERVRERRVLRLSEHRRDGLEVGHGRPEVSAQPNGALAGGAHLQHLRRNAHGARERRHLAQPLDEHVRGRLAGGGGLLLVLALLHLADAPLGGVAHALLQPRVAVQVLRVQPLLVRRAQRRPAAETIQGVLEQVPRGVARAQRQRRVVELVLERRRRAVLEEDLDDLGVPARRRQVQRRVQGLVRVVRVVARLQQRPHHLDVTTVGRPVQRRVFKRGILAHGSLVLLSLLVDGRRVKAEQQPHELEVAIVRRPVQRRPERRLIHVRDGHALLDELLHLAQIITLRSRKKVRRQGFRVDLLLLLLELVVIKERVVVHAALP
mmetsp:Transcript_16742/g.51454  ORF Transcript_16742/g.51454 Transcript_16742/m.51454 type:complete len:388 (-) Transcript_16742:121-1284(-)